MEDMFIIPVVVIGLPWLILHYITKWKTAATITQDDEGLLDELYQLAAGQRRPSRIQAGPPRPRQRCRQPAT